MANLSQHARNSVALQAEMFRLADRQYGLSRRVLHQRTGISESTLRDWASGETQMPAWALGELGIPDELTSLVLDPFGKHIGTNEPGEGDLDALGRESAGFVADKLDREADGVVCHLDKAALKRRARKIVSVARSAAA